MEPQAGSVAKACTLSLPFTQLAWVGLGLPRPCCLECLLALSLWSLASCLPPWDYEHHWALFITVVSWWAPACPPGC